MPLVDLLKERFKITTRGVQNPNGLLQADNTPRLVLSNNPNRLGFIIINLSLNPMFVALDRGVGAAHGIRLDPSGGSFGCVWDEDFELTAWAWWIRAPAGASDLYSLAVVEG